MVRGMEWKRVALAVALVAGCHRPDVPAVTPAPLRDQARLVLEAHCGECHIRGYDSAKAGALGIFDLMEADWATRMTEPQLRNALWRLGEPFDEHAQPRAVPEADQKLFERFVEAELHRREAAQAGRP